MNKHQDKRSKLVSLATLVILASLIGGLWVNQNRLLDWWRLRDYTPPADIVSLADQATLNNYGRHLFYINHPRILATVQAFRQSCPENQETIVLGCYHSGQNGIYMYQVPDISLTGVEQVTAAHEMLHAAYSRLNSHDRAILNAQLEAFYKTGLKDQSVKDEIKVYQSTEPLAVTDEMHSLFGTEVANLPPPLEAYYKRYFTDRTKVVAYNQQYQGQFLQRQATIAEDDRQLATMKHAIDDQEAMLKAQLAQINADRTRIEGYLAANDVTQYNAAVSGFNAEISTYNAGIVRLKAQTNAYNALVADRNQIARQLATLDKALDTRTAQPANH